MTAPLNILAAALDKVQLDPAGSLLPSRAQAEQAALLVIAHSEGAAEEPEQYSTSALLPYLKEVERAKDGLRRALADMDEDVTPFERSALQENFERAQDVYYQATASVAELVKRMVLPSSIRQQETDDVWESGYT